MHFRIVALIVFFSFPVTAAELFTEFNPKLFKDRSKQIEPDRSVYGLKFGSTEKELISAFGKPNGIIRISDSKQALLYGSSHIFILRKGRLRELMVGTHVISWQLSRQMENHPFFDRGNWVLKPGIKNEMDFSEIKKLLKKPNAKPDHRYNIEGEFSSTTLNFSSWAGESRPTKYKLFSFIIKHYGF